MIIRDCSGTFKEGRGGMTKIKVYIIDAFDGFYFDALSNSD